MSFSPDATDAPSKDFPSAGVPGASPVALIARAERVVLLVAVLLIAGLHAINLFSAGPLWRDEVGDAVYAAMPSWAHIWSMLKYDNFPLGLLVCLRAWRGLGLENLGGPDFGYRIYGLLVGLALPGALWFNARVFGGPRNAPWFSLGLLAAGGFFVRVGDSVRPYGLGWVFMLLTFGLIWRVVQAPRPGRIAAAALVAVCSVQSLYQNAFLLLAMGAAGMIVAARAGRWRAVAAVAGIGGVSAASLLPYVLGPIHDANGWSMVSRAGLPWHYMGYMLWDAAGSLEPMIPWLWLAAAAGLAAAVFPRAGAAHANGPGNDAADTPTPDVRWYVVGSTLIVFPMFLGFLKYLGMITMPWYYYLPLAMAASTLDALGAALTENVRWRAARLAFLLVALAFALPFGWNLTQVRVTNADLLARQVTQAAQPGDCVLVCPWTFGVSFAYYYHGAVPWTTLPALEDSSIHRYDLLKERVVSRDPIAPVLARLADTLRAGHRVWIVGEMNVPPEGQQPHVLLPAPHDPRAGWDEATYMLTWTEQTGDFLRRHALNATEVPTPRQQVSVLEKMSLYRLEGWQE